MRDWDGTLTKGKFVVGIGAGKPIVTTGGIGAEQLGRR